MDVNDGMAPLDVVVRILNNQLSSLMWIDEKVSTLHNFLSYFYFLTRVQFVGPIVNMQLNVTGCGHPCLGNLKTCVT